MKPNHLIANSCTTMYAIFAKYLDICKQFAGNLVNERNNINAVITPLKQCLNAVFSIANKILFRSLLKRPNAAVNA